MADQTRDMLTSIVDSVASRRRMLGGLVGGTVAGLLGWQESDADRKRRKTGRDRRRNQHDNTPRVNAQRKSNDGPATLRVMTRNIYFGTDLSPVFEVVNPQDLPGVVADVFALVEATNFPERAKALAREIATFNPHLVGLQEVALWRSQSPADFNPTPNALTVEYDFLAILLEELAQRGKSYEAVAIVQNTDAEAPRIGPTGLEDIRFTDRDVMLARTDFPATSFAVTDTQSDNFVATFTLDNDVLGLIPIPRGWTAVDATLAGRAVRVVNTHLEPLHPGIQVEQGNELLAGPLDTALPVVLVGDLNSAAESIGPVPPVNDTPTYDNILAAGFFDAAASKKGKKPVFTCCQDADLMNKTSNLTVRIDFVLTRGGFKASAVKVVGDKRGDKTPSGLWPSDHAGVTAVLHLKHS